MNIGGCKWEPRHRVQLAKNAMGCLTKINQTLNLKKLKLNSVGSLIFSMYSAGKHGHYTEPNVSPLNPSNGGGWMLRIPWTAERTNESVLKEFCETRRLLNEILIGIGRIFFFFFG